MGPGGSRRWSSSSTVGREGESSGKRQLQLPFCRELEGNGIRVLHRAVFQECHDFTVL